jgi:hypothetical protein
MHLHESGIVLSPPKETAVIDLRDAFQSVRWLWRRAVACGSMPVVHENPAVKLLDRPRPRAMSGVWFAPVRVADDTAVAADFPPMERTLDRVALHLPVSQVGAEVGAIGIHRMHLPGGVAEHHPLISHASHELGAGAEIARATDDVPGLGIRGRIARLPDRLDERI